MTDIVFDPHVADAVVCILLAFFVVLFLMMLQSNSENHKEGGK